MQTWRQLSLWDRCLSILFCSFALTVLAANIFLFVYHPKGATPTPASNFMFVIGLCFLFFAVAANPNSYRAPFSFRFHDFFGWTKYLAFSGVAILALAAPFILFLPDR